MAPDPRDLLPTAEALMRSRFEAFRDGDAEWLLRSWHPSTRPAEVDLGDNPTWRRLQIVETVGGGPDDDEGIVEFRASWSRDAAEGGAATSRERRHGVLHERSRFVREHGRWYYVDGDVE